MCHTNTKASGGGFVSAAAATTAKRLKIVLHNYNLCVDHLFRTGIIIKL
jgi:hypothetical protein